MTLNGKWSYFALFHRIRRRKTIMRPASVSNEVYDHINMI